MWLHDTTFAFYRLIKCGSSVLSSLILIRQSSTGYMVRLLQATGWLHSQALRAGYQLINHLPRGLPFVLATNTGSDLPVYIKRMNMASAAGDLVPPVLTVATGFYASLCIFRSSIERTKDRQGHLFSQWVFVCLCKSRAGYASM